MNILILGSGGREHAIATQVAKSPQCSQLFIAPGNAGTTDCATNIDIKVSDFEAIKQFVVEHQVEMVIVGPEQPLVDGIVDRFTADAALKDVMIIGPTAQGAQLEGSKDFAKQFMQRHNIPTAAYRTFSRDTLSEGIDFLSTLRPPYVLKADGLAAGKGVLIVNSLEEAKAELQAMLSDAKFGTASSKVVIEEYLSGIELSVFVLTDGRHYKILPTAKDYKRIGEGDTGLNTGGMGSISPVPFAETNDGTPSSFMKKVEERIIIPTIQGLQQEGITYKGFIFFGLMATTNASGNMDPYVIEYNVRMGDPETESVFPRIESDVVELFKATWESTLNNANLSISSKVAACVMLTAKGYPESYVKGDTISGLDAAATQSNIKSHIFHAGTAKNREGDVVTNGGRVLCVTSLDDSFQSALQNSLSLAEKIQWDGRYFRRDIGLDLVPYIL